MQTYRRPIYNVDEIRNICLLQLLGLSMPCVLGLSPAGSSSSVHGRGWCKKRHPNIESLKRSLRKEATDFPVDVFRNSIDEWPLTFKGCVRANGGHFE